MVESMNIIPLYKPEKQHRILSSALQKMRLKWPRSDSLSKGKHTLDFNHSSQLAGLFKRYGGFSKATMRPWERS